MFGAAAGCEVILQHPDWRLCSRQDLRRNLKFLKSDTSGLTDKLFNKLWLLNMVKAASSSSHLSLKSSAAVFNSASEHLICTAAEFSEVLFVF